MKERIQKLLAAAGVDSRRNVEEMVLQGRISVNGTILRDLPILIDPKTDDVAVDGDPIRLTAGRGGKNNRVAADRVYVLMNKPRGVFCTNVAQETNQGEQIRAIDLLPPGFYEKHRVYPVGRLDAESRGLLLLTNDGDLTNKLTHPRYGVPKTYRATVDGRVTPDGVAELEQGVWLADPKKGGAKTARSRIKIVRGGRDKSVLEITIKEGRNRQVRRMLAGMGHKVRDLVRVKLGPLTIEGLKPSQSRLLTPREVRDLTDAVKARKRSPQVAGSGSPGRVAPKPSRPTKKKATYRPA